MCPNFLHVHDLSIHLIWIGWGASFPFSWARFGEIHGFSGQHGLIGTASTSRAMSQLQARRLHWNPHRIRYFNGTVWQISYIYIHIHQDWWVVPWKNPKIEIGLTIRSLNRFDIPIYLSFAKFSDPGQLFTLVASRCRSPYLGNDPGLDALGFTLVSPWRRPRSSRVAILVPRIGWSLTFFPGSHCAAGQLFPIRVDGRHFVGLYKP